MVWREEFMALFLVVLAAIFLEDGKELWLALAQAYWLARLIHLEPVWQVLQLGRELRVYWGKVRVTWSLEKMS